MPPPTTTARLALELPDDFDTRLHVLHRSLRKNPVTEIEDMPRPRTRALQQFVNAHTEFRQWCEEHGWVQISLHCGAIGNVHPRLIDIDAPIDAHDVAPGG